MRKKEEEEIDDEGVRACVCVRYDTLAGDDHSRSPVNCIWACKQAQQIVVFNRDTRIPYQNN